MSSCRQKADGGHSARHTHPLLWRRHGLCLRHKLYGGGGSGERSCGGERAHNLPAWQSSISPLSASRALLGASGVAPCCACSGSCGRCGARTMSSGCRRVRFVLSTAVSPHCRCAHTMRFCFTCASRAGIRGAEAAEGVVGGASCPGVALYTPPACPVVSSQRQLMGSNSIQPNPTHR